jgi:hypothetical protein
VIAAALTPAGQTQAVGMLCKALIGIVLDEAAIFAELLAPKNTQQIRSKLTS